MKKLFLSAIVFLFVSTAFASNNNEDPTVVSKTTKELSLLLNKSYTGDILEKEELVKVTFVVNKLKQVVVLQVNSDNSQIQDYVKQVLNYKKLSSNELVVGKDYVFEVRFKN